MYFKCSTLKSFDVEKKKLKKIYQPTNLRFMDFNMKETFFLHCLH